MSVIVCRQQRALHPLYIEGLGIKVYTCQELCYAIYHHVLLFLDGFVDKNLIDFVRDELNMEFAAVRMEQWMKSGEKPEEVLFVFMQECDYYTTLELNRLKQTVASLKRLPAFEYTKKKADYLAHARQYEKAIVGYKEVLESIDNKIDNQFVSRTLNNLGVCYARVFQFKKAMDVYEKAYDKKKDIRILENMYHLTKMNPELKLKEKYHSFISEQLIQQWEKDFETAVEKAKEADGIQKLRNLFEKESDQREEEMTHLVEQWKEEYRNMGLH